MAVVHEDEAFSGDEEANGNMTITMPSTVPDGDLILTSLSADDIDAIVDYNGFTATSIDEVGGTGSRWIASIWREASSLAASYVVDRSGGTETWAAASLRFSGADTSDPIGAISTETSGSPTGPGFSCTAPAVTAESADSLIVRCWAFDAMSGARWTDLATATGEVGRVDSGGLTSSLTGAIGIVVAVEASPGASTTTGTSTITYDNAGAAVYSAWTLEILPSGGGGGPSPSVKSVLLNSPLLNSPLIGQ